MYRALSPAHAEPRVIVPAMKNGFRASIAESFDVMPKEISFGLPSMTSPTLAVSVSMRRPFAVLVAIVLAVATPECLFAGKAPPIGSHIAPGDPPTWIPIRIWQEVFAATTPSGKQLSASEVKPLVLAVQWPPPFWTSTGWHLRCGVFLLKVRPDGSVSRVETLQSIGPAFLDRDVTKAFARWRFRPNSVKEVRVPAYYSFD
jgi:TonB family protein